MTAKPIFLRRLLLLAGALISLIAVQSGSADTLKLKSDAPESYTVVKGDTLWGISERYLDKPWLWPELWEGNPQINNPHLIYPGDVLSLHYVDGQPRLGINRQSGAQAGNAQPRDLRLSPQIKSTPIDNAIPTVNIESVQQFLKNIRIIDKSLVDTAPYIVRGQEGRIIAARGDRIYAMRMNRNIPGDRYQVYHVGEAIIDPSTDETIGYEGIFVGDAKLERIGSPSKLLMLTSKRETAQGDLLLATPSEVELSNFYPETPENTIQAKVLNVVDGTGIIGLHQAVIINAGTRHGLKRGHVLSTYSKTEHVYNNVTKDQQSDTVIIPNERTGTLMIVKTFENLSYALVMESRSTIRILDDVRTPE